MSESRNHSSESSHLPSFSRAYEPYVVESFTELDDVERAHDMQRMQGESYVAEGYLDQSVLETDGRLPECLDHSRGDHVTYFHAKPGLEGLKGEASGRVIDFPLQSLFAYSLDIFPKYHDQLNEMQASGRPIRELGGISLRGEAESIASFSIVREVIQRAIRHSSNEIILGSQTDHALHGFRMMFGDTAVKRIGDSTILNTGMGHEVKLTPVMADICKTPDSMIKTIQSAATESRMRSKLVRSLGFLVDGLYRNEVSEDVNDFLETTLKVALPEAPKGGQ